jgi:precorrin-2 dehydrogenase / sirohydrochlorin ferrochelatase
VSAVDYPVCLRLTGRPVLVVGAGAIAAGRIRGLLTVGASVRVVATRALPEVREAAERGEISLELRGYRAGDLAGAMLVIVAVDDPLLGEQIYSAARARGQWCTVADRPALCDFTMPSVGRRGPITVAVSTSGKAPALAARLRRRFEVQIWPEDLAIAAGVDALRSHLPAGAARMRFLKRVVTVAERATSTIRRVVSAAASRSRVEPASPGQASEANAKASGGMS